MVIKLSKDDLTNDHSPKIPGFFDVRRGVNPTGNDSNLLIVFYVQIMPDDFVMQLHRF